MSTAAEESRPVPVVTITRGTATPEEVAALSVIYLALRARGQEDGPARHRAGWGHRARTFNPGAVRGAGWGPGL